MEMEKLLELGWDEDELDFIPLRSDLTSPFLLLVTQTPRHHARQLPCCYPEPRGHNLYTDSNCGSLWLGEISS